METALLAGLGMAGVYTLSKNISPLDNKQRGDPYLRQPHPHYSNNPSNYQGQHQGNSQLERNTNHSIVQDKTSIHDYHNPNQTTDKLYDMDNFNAVGTRNIKQGIQGNTDFTSLSGEPMNTNTFNHNNMAPYFGSKVKGVGANVDTSELYLDRKVGMGSQHFNKREQAPLFKPQKDLAWASGMPNQSDFIQSRMNASNVHNNTKPWEEIQVGPSLSGNAGVNGSGGFNSGLENRQSYLPKRVDELRVESNPKVSYQLNNHEGAATANVKNRSIMGEYNYYGPDTYFVNTPDRYLVTTGLEKKQRGRGIHDMKEQARIETTREYQGGAGQNDVRASMAPHNYQDPKREHVYGSVEGPAYANNKSDPTDNDYSSKGFNVIPNNRAVTQQKTVFGTVKGIFEAMVSPILDTMKPTRKETILGNMIERGNVGTIDSDGIYIVSPELNARTTYREMNPTGKQHVFVGNQDGNNKFLGNTSYMDEPLPQQRDTTTRSYTGTVGDASMGIQHQSHVRDNQRNNNNRISAASQVHGNTNMFNSEVNGTRNTSRNTYNYSNSGMAQHHKGMLGPEDYATVTSQPSDYRDKDYGDRINPDLLQAFKSNPYTHSLNSSV